MPFPWVAATDGLLFFLLATLPGRAYLLMMSRLRFGNRVYVLPGSRLARIAIGAFLVILGCFGFLPILGFWMIPLGLLVLSIDLPWVRRKRREQSVRWSRWLRERYPGLWRRFIGDAGGKSG